MLRRFGCQEPERDIAVLSPDVEMTMKHNRDFPDVSRAFAMGLALAVTVGGLYLFAASFHPSSGQRAMLAQNPQTTSTVLYQSASGFRS